MNLTNVSPEQLAALQNNFEAVVISEAEEKGKYDVTIPMGEEKDYWRLFFSGAEYAQNILANMRRSSLNIKP